MAGAALLALVFLWMPPKGSAVLRPVHESTRTARSSPSKYANRSILPSRAPSEVPVIKGFVYDVEGHPLRDAVVSATTFDIAGNIPSTAAFTKTDELGRFELELLSGTYQIGAILEGFGTASTTAHTGDDISLVLSASGVIVGRVRDERGDPISNFSVDVVVAAPMDMAAPPPVFSRRYATLDGAFRVDQLPVWTVMVRASAEGYAAAYSPDLNVQPGRTQKVDLTLTRGCVLTGKVAHASGDPAKGILVDVESQFGSGLIGTTSALTTSQAESDDHGRFRIEHVPTGSIVVRAYDGESAASTVTREVTDCANIEPVELVMGTGGILSGVARRGDGTPLPGARLTFQHRGVGFVSTVSDAEGRYRFDRLPTGLGRLALVGEGQTVEKMVRATDGKEVRLDIALIPEGTGRVQGHITAGGKPLAGLRLVLVGGRQRGLIFHYVTTGPDGTYSLENLAPGTYDLEVDSTLAAAVVRIRSGQAAKRDIDVTAQLASRPVSEPETRPASAPAEGL
jgi:hypothetical protein